MKNQCLNYNYTFNADYPVEKLVNKIAEKLSTLPPARFFEPDTTPEILSYKEDKLENKSAETIDFLSFELFESNTGQIALTFYKNLKKY